MQVLQYAQEMVSIDSVSSRSNAKIAALMRRWLEQLGFTVEQLEMTDPAGELKVSLVARRGPAPKPGAQGIAYFCHNDVVPVDDWSAAAGGPFSAAVSQDRLWGRGSCDMKGSAAAALSALSQIKPEDQVAPIYFVVTSDEEHGMHGAKLVSQKSRFFEEMVAAGTYGIIGEPTELHVVNAHKGGCYFNVVSRGRAAHSSTANGLNANWQLIDFLQYLKQVHQRTESEARLQNSSFEPATLSLNLVVKNRPDAANITVGHASCQIFMRTMPDVAWDELADEIANTAQSMGLEVALLSKLPPVFTSPKSPFVKAAMKLSGDKAPGSVSYATDGCWFTRLKDLIVLGPGSIEQAHRPDEWIALDQLHRGQELYRKFFEKFAVQSNVNSSTQSTSTQMIPQAVTTNPPPPTVEFRRGTDRDVEGVNNFLRPFVNQRKLLRRTQTEMELLVPSGYIAEVNGNIVGFAAVEIYSRKLAEIQCLAVEPNFQGHGIGSELVRNCVELARQRGVLEVLAISSSDSFLQKLGFNYSLPDQKRALFCQLRSRDEMYGSEDDDSTGEPAIEEE